jgi:hypothetical protein
VFTARNHLPPYSGKPVSLVFRLTTIERQPPYSPFLNIRQHYLVSVPLLREFGFLLLPE